MKLNEKLIKHLANGEIAYQHTGTDEEGYVILSAAFPKSYNLNWKKECLDELRFPFYRKSPQSPNRCVGRTYIKEIESFTTDQFFEPDTDTTEVRELAKQLFVAYIQKGQLPTHSSMDNAIRDAKQFVELLNKEL